MQVDPSSLTHPQLAWHPDGGQVLAVPGSDNDVVLYERLNWEPTGEALQGGHSATITAFAFCPNGAGSLRPVGIGCAFGVGCRQ